MLIIGERLNSSREEIARVFRNRDVDGLTREVISQVKAGAQFLDINTGALMRQEAESMTWAIQQIQEITSTQIGVCIDSKNFEVLAAALKVCERPVIVNSVDGDAYSLETVGSLAARYGATVIALCMDVNGPPTTANNRLEIANRIMGGLEKVGVGQDSVLFDPLVQPVSVAPAAAEVTIETIRRLKENGYRTVCGVSNVSFGLPVRRLLNRAFLAMAVAAGLDAAIMDPLDTDSLKLVLATEVICGKDNRATRYISAFKEGRLR